MAAADRAQENCELEGSFCKAEEECGAGKPELQMQEQLSQHAEHIGLEEALPLDEGFPDAGETGLATQNAEVSAEQSQQERGQPGLEEFVETLEELNAEHWEAVETTEVMPSEEPLVEVNLETALEPVVEFVAENTMEVEPSMVYTLDMGAEPIGAETAMETPVEPMVEPLMCAEPTTPVAELEELQPVEEQPVLEQLPLAPAADSTLEPVAELIVEAIVEPATEETGPPSVVKTGHPVAEPTQTVLEPVVEASIVQLVVEPVVEPVAEPVVVPGVESVDEPVVVPVVVP